MDDLKRYLIEETVEDYRDGRLTRRQAMTALAGLTGALVGAELLAGCGRREPATEEPAVPVEPAGSGSAAPTAPAQPSPDSVAAGDPAVVAATAQFPGEGATLTGYLARPAKTGTYPIVLVCHENRGLTPYVEDVTRR